jgi:hypothetical protein
MIFPFNKIIKVLTAVPKVINAITKLIKVIKGTGNGEKKEEEKK